jgi:hypothetical protein
MKIIKNLLIPSCLIGAVSGCKPQNQEKQMQEIIQQELALTQTYTHRPTYGTQVNKNGCKLIIEVEGAQDYRFTNNTGQSTMFPINVLLFDAAKKISL